MVKKSNAYLLIATEKNKVSWHYIWSCPWLKLSQVSKSFQGRGKQRIISLWIPKWRYQITSPDITTLGQFLFLAESREYFRGALQRIGENWQHDTPTSFWSWRIHNITNLWQERRMKEFSGLLRVICKPGCSTFCDRGHTFSRFLQSSGSGRV